MKITGRIIAGILTLMFLYAGFIVVFNITTGIAGEGVEAINDISASNIRANGAVMLSWAIFTAVAAIKSERQWMLVPAVAFVFILFSRIVGMLSGLYNSEIVSITVSAVVISVMCIASYYLIGKKNTENEDSE